jgi:hypothetical protein
MLKHQTLLSELSPEQLEQLFGRCLNHHLTQFRAKFPKEQLQEELLTREETSKFLKIDLSTLYHWTKKGKVKVYSIGSRRYYLKSEILKALKPLNSSSHD